MPGLEKNNSRRAEFIAILRSARSARDNLGDVILAQRHVTERQDRKTIRISVGPREFVMGARADFERAGNQFALRVFQLKRPGVIAIARETDGDLVHGEAGQL